MTNRIRQAIGLVFAALVSGAYWFGVLALLEGATSINYSAGLVPMMTR